MSRTLILIAAPSLVVTSLALSAAQQLPNVTPGMVEMTEPPTPAAAGFNNRTIRCVDRAAAKRRVRGPTMQEGKSAAYTTGSR
jgi:hypothetical protein